MASRKPAIALWREAGELDTGHPLGCQGEGVARCQAGEVEQAIELLQRARLLSDDDPLVIADLAHCYAASGRSSEARALLAELEARSADSWVSPIGLALVHLSLGERDRAFDELEHAYTVRAYRLLEIGVDPRWDSLRHDPRFRDVLRRMGLEEASA